MLNILTILSYIKSNLHDPEGRFSIIDDEHIIDTKTGVELHMYDDVFKMTHGNAVVATIHDTTLDEQTVVWEIKQMITDPEKAQKRLAERPQKIKERRARLSELFENPTPIHTLETEPEAVAYNG